MIDICRNYKHYHINVWQSRENLLVPFMFLLMILSLGCLLPGGQPNLSSPAGRMTGEGEMDMVEYLPGTRERSGIRARSE